MTASTCAALSQRSISAATETQTGSFVRIKEEIRPFLPLFRKKYGVCVLARLHRFHKIVTEIN